MRKSWKTGLVVALFGLAVVACGGNGEGEWQGTVEDSAGTEVVTSTGSGIWGPGAGWTVARDLVIGTAEGAPELQFGQISGIDVGADGRIYVLDQQARQVRVFSPRGEYLHAMGKEGTGPGELSQGAGPLFVSLGDTVLVPDVMQQRLTRYTADGQPAASYPLPMTEGIPARWMEAPDQTLVQQAVIMQLPGQEAVEPRSLILRRAPSGAVQDTLLELPAGRTVSFAGGQPSITLFEAEPMWAVGQDGRLYYGSNAEYRLHTRAAGGPLERIIARDVQRRPVTEADQAEYRRIIERLWRDQGMPPQAIQMMTQAVRFAPFYPAYANILAGPEGTLWVQRVQTPEEVAQRGAAFDLQDMGSASWDVFDENGRYLGLVEMPPRFNPMVFIGDELYGVLRDDLDVQYAARMKVVRHPAGVPTG